MTAQLPDRVDTAIVGAGLAGLSCARCLHGAGQSVVVVEASDGVGGRVRTDLVDGFRLDRGFQVLLTAYPEVQRQIDLAALDMHTFTPGATVWIRGEGFDIGDPFRDRSTLLDTERSPVLPLGDKLRILRLRTLLRRGEARRLFGKPEQTTRTRLAALGFSDSAVTRFFGPLFSGIQPHRPRPTSPGCAPAGSKAGSAARWPVGVRRPPRYGVNSGCDVLRPPHRRSHFGTTCIGRLRPA